MVKMVHGEPTLAFRFMNYEIPGKVLFHKILPYYDNDYFLGIVVYRLRTNFESDSGFVVHGPSQIFEKNKGMSLNAFYPPNLSLLEEGNKNLDYGS